MYAMVRAYIAGNLTREVKNENMDRYRPAWHDGRIRADYIGLRRQQDICGDVAGDVILLSNYCRVFRNSLNCT